MKQKLLILLTLLTFCTAASSAQRNYPVRATVQYTPPYSLFLGDYATPKLIITLTGQDLLDANCPYKLSFSLECQNVKVTTKPSFNPAPLYINGGQTIVLTGTDLARYFDIQNLDFHGITAAKYLQDGQLPEGFYRMNVKVIHYHENRVISNTAFTMFNARMGKPPVLSLPKNKTLIPPAQQQSPIVFSWIPKTVGAFNYKFELWECAVPGIPVQTVVSTVRPIYSQTYTTSQITFQPNIVNMKPGMEYAWRITVEDPHNQQKFANQGQSEIFTFTYKRKPEPVTGLRFTNRGLKITWTWDMDPAHTKYYFEYYDPQTGRTIDPVACDYAEFVRNMPQTGYHLKVRVKAECYGDPTLMSDYTPYLDTYLEPIPVPEYECGKVFEDREITNLELKHTFAPGEIVESKNGDTRYEIIFSEEKNGYLSGQFYMIMDCWGGAKIKCEFSKTQINTDNIVLNTIFHNVPDSTLYVKPETIRKEIQEAFFDAATVLTDFSIKDTVKIDKPYTYLYINESGKVVAVSVNNNGKTEEKTTEISATNLKENTLIQGKNGEELVLTKKGQVMGKNEFNATGGNSVLLKEYHRKSDSLAQWQINFSKYDAQTYAFDHIGSGNHGIFSGADYYPQVGSYDFRYKSVECGKNDKVIVEFGSYPQADSVVFKDKYGVTYPISSKDNVLSFTGVSKADTNYIYAYRGDKKIGKLFLNTYQKKTYKVVFVRVNGAAKKLNAKEITKYLNKVYNQCAVSFEDSIDNITIGNLTSFSHGGSGILTVYNDYQKEVLQAYEKEKKMKDGVFYLFFIDNVTDKKDGSGTPVSGYMPRGYNAGFIYDGGSPHTIAHELGHGVAGLEHVFENSSNSGKTQNLMDYASGEELWHFQWDQIQDPSRVWMKWNKEEGEGELSHATCVAMSDDLKKIRVFILSDGTRIKLPDNFTAAGFVWSGANNLANTTGALAVINDGNYDYVLESDKECNHFGYKDDFGTFHRKYTITNDMRVFETAASVSQSDKTFEISWNDIKVVAGSRLCIFPENDIYKTLYTEMSDEDYQEAVDRLVSRLNQQVSDKDYFIVDGDADQSNEAKDYRDRFNVFHSATDNSIYVDVCCFNKKPTAEQISKMAKDVFEKSTLKDDDKSIYLVLPVWSEHKIKNDLRSYDKQYFSRSFYTQSQKYSGIAQTSEYKSATGNPVDIIDQFYRLVPKPHISIPYTIKYDGTIIRLDNTKEDNITGYSYIYDFKLAYEPLFDDYAPIIKRYRDNNPSYGDMYYYYQSQKEDKLREVYNRLGNGNDVEYVPVKHGLKESFLKPNTAGVSETAERYAQWFVLHKLGGAGIKDNLNNDLFVGGKNEVVYEETLSTIDELGFFLMTVGADFVTDAIGCLYAAYHQEKGDAAIYTAGFLGFAIPGGVLRKVLKNEYKIVREGENTIKVVDKSGNVVHQTKATIAGNLSDFVSKIKQLANDDATANALITKVDNLKEAKDEFLTAFSILNDDELKLFLENPRMVDAWNDLNELLRQYPKAYESIIKNEMKIESLTKYADDPSNIARVKTTLDMSVAEIPVEWITDEICDKFFKNKSYLNVWNDLEKVGKERFSNDGFAAFDNYVKNRNITSEITDSEKMMTNILSDVRGKRIIGNVEMDYDDLFKDYFKHLDPETLAKFDKPMLDAWHKMMDRRMPETWCRDVDIVEKIKSNNRYITYWDELKDVEAYPLTLKGDDFSVFDHYVTKQLGYTFKQMREISFVPDHWLEDLSVIERFKQYSETCKNNWRVLLDKDIIIEDFDFLYALSKKMKDNKYAEFSIANIERTLSTDFRDDVVSLIKNQKLTHEDFRALIGDWEHCENFKIGKFKEMFKVFEKKPTVHLEFRKKAIKEFFIDAEGKDIRDALIAEFIANPISKILAQYIKSRDISSSWDIFITDIKQNGYLIDWIESSIRNALQSISSINPKNTFRQNLIKMLPHILTNIPYNQLITALQKEQYDKFRTMLCRELIKAFIDYGFNKSISTSGLVKTSLFQGFKDTFHNLTDDIIDNFINDLYFLLNKN